LGEAVVEETKEFKYEKETWARGPWDTEPDRLEFEAEGFPCLMVRNKSGAWCGYVGVPPTHPWHGTWYGGCTKGCTPTPWVPPEERWKLVDGEPEHTARFKREMLELEAKGGSKFWGKEWHDAHPKCEEFNHSPESIIHVHGGLTYSEACQGVICHTPKPGEPENVWWFGFDCAHAWDLAPGMHKFRMEHFPEHDREDVYRDMAYCRAEVQQLATQLKAIAG
jgi:hypothetical protein